MLNSYAVFDCLFVGTKLQASLGNVASGEIQLFAYLACLLSLYKGRPVAEWGYKFAGTEYGAPFSPEIDSSINQLLASGLFTYSGKYLQVTDKGQTECRVLLSLSQNAQRETFLEGACGSILALPLGIVREALHNEPELKSSISLASERMLLDESNPGLSILYEQFEALNRAIGVEVSSLTISSVTWLTYLSQISKNSIARSQGT